MWRTDPRRDESGQAWVGVEKEPPLSDAVRHIDEPVGKHRIKIFKNRLLQNLRMEGGNAVDFVRALDRQVSHADLSSFDHRHAAHDLFLTGKVLPHGCT